MSGVGRRLGLARVRCTPLGSWYSPVSTGVVGHSCQAFYPPPLFLAARSLSVQPHPKHHPSEKHGWVATGSNGLEPVTSPYAIFGEATTNVCQSASLTNPRHPSYFLFRDEWSPGDRNREVGRGRTIHCSCFGFNDSPNSATPHIRFLLSNAHDAEDSFPPRPGAATHSPTYRTYLASSHWPAQSSTPRLSSLVPIKAP
jgi:hypothetical protein